MLYIHKSNDVDALVDDLVPVLVAHRERQRAVHLCAPSDLRIWLEETLARRLGVSTWSIAPYRAVFARLCRDWWGVEETPGWEDAACFAAAALLRDDLPGIGDSPVAGAVADDAVARRWDVAAQFAQMVGRYAYWRPDMVCGWMRGVHAYPGDGDEAWQAALLSRMGDAGLLPPPVRWALAAMDDAVEPPADGDRACIALFGYAELRPLYVHLMRKAAARADVHLFVPASTPQFLGYMGDDPTLHVFWRAWGMHEAALQQRLQELSEEGAHEHENWRPHAGPGGFLGAMQRMVLGEEAGPVPPWDDTVHVLAAPTRRREVEGVFDRLVALFEANPDLHPEDILILAPDVDAYAPWVLTASEATGIPVTLTCADPDAMQWEQLYLDVLDLAGQGVPLDAAFDVLGAPVVRERLGLSLQEVHEWRGRMADSGVRRFADQAHRALFVEGAGEYHTWEFGWRRVLCSLAVEDAMVGTVRPTAMPPWNAVPQVGVLADALDALCTLARHTHVPAAWHEWTRRLEAALAGLLRFGESENAPQGYTRVLTRLRELDAAAAAWGAQAAESVPFDVYQARVRATLAPDGVRTVGRGGVLVDTLRPLRGRRYGAVVLLGMSEDDFPAPPRYAAFDLMSRERRLGDPDPAQRAQRAFLEAFLGAEEVFIAAFSGDQPVPCGPLALWMSEAARWAGCPESELLTRLPAHGFDAAHFAPSNGRLQRFDGDDYAVALHIAGHGSQAPAPDAPPPLPVPEVVTPVTLARFWRDPAHYYLHALVGAAELPELQARSALEPLTLARDLRRWQVRREVLAQMASAEEPRGTDRLQEWLLADGRLPEWPLGALEVRDVEDFVRRLLDTARRILSEKLGARLPLDPHSAYMDVDVSCAVADHVVRIRGRVRDVCPAGVGRVEPSQLKWKKVMALWIDTALVAVQRGAAAMGIAVGSKSGDRVGCFLCRLDPEEARLHLDALAAEFVAAHTDPLPLDGACLERVWDAVKNTPDEAMEKGLVALRRAARDASFDAEASLARLWPHGVDVCAAAGRWRRVIERVVAPMARKMEWWNGK